MKIQEEILNKLLDRLIDGAAKYGGAEFELAQRRQFEAACQREVAAKDHEIGELKRLYDAAREEAQRGEPVLAALIALRDAVLPTSRRRSRRFNDTEMANLGAALAEAERIIDYAVPF